MRSSEQLVDRIYEAAAFSDEWPSVLHEIAGQVEAAGALLLVRRSDAWTGWRRSPGIGMSVETYLRSTAATQSITTERLARAGRAGFVADHELFSETEYRADPMMTEWAAPAGLYHGAATGIHMSTGDYAVVQVQRRAGRPRFDGDDLSLLNGFRPHLARAALLASRWRLERLAAMTEALELIGLPAAVLDRSARVVAANPLIEGMTTHVVWHARDRLNLTDPAAATVLRHTLAAGDGGRSFPVNGGEDVAPAVAHLIPTAGRSRDLFAGGYVLLVLGPLRGAEGTIIRSLYDLTPAEIDVALLLAEGVAPADIATRRSVSLDTVRNQIRSLLLKTGTTRLGGLIALLARTIQTQ